MSDRTAGTKRPTLLVAALVAILALTGGMASSAGASEGDGDDTLGKSIVGEEALVSAVKLVDDTQRTARFSFR